jgi:glutathione S-transferase
MTLTLYFHPLASFCHKVLMALYEHGTPFTGHVVDMMDEDDSASFLSMWPVGKIPVLRDESRDRTLPETTIIIEYLDQHYPGARALLPEDEAKRLDARLWDRLFDLYVQVPMQKVVTDYLRPHGEKDARGVADAEATLATAYDMIERQMDERTWAVGEAFSIADCAAAPALFYAGVVLPFSETHPNVVAYFERLLERPSFKRVLADARPYSTCSPLRTIFRHTSLTGRLCRPDRPD